MTTINLRDFYPWYRHDEFVEVSNEVAAAMLEGKRQERNYTRRMYYNKAQYSLDAGDGIENETVYADLSSHEVYELKLRMCRLCRALNSLPEPQGRRIDAHFILGMSKADIARAEGVRESAVRGAIERGLKSMKKYLRNN